MVWFSRLSNVDQESNKENEKLSEKNPCFLSLLFNFIVIPFFYKGSVMPLPLVSDGGGGGGGSEGEGRPRCCSFYISTCESGKNINHFLRTPPPPHPPPPPKKNNNQKIKNQNEIH